VKVLGGVFSYGRKMHNNVNTNVSLRFSILELYQHQRVTGRLYVQCYSSGKDYRNRRMGV
jgi:hypothetical protein